ncbi:MAG: diguanylate cyclase [Candidatus Cloacimonetes bacterium]|nr:diguanylate cyclase [Candidatus Cloacimonadota bacterium]
MQKKILIVYDKIQAANDIKNTLEDLKYKVVDVVTDSESAVAAIKNENPNLVLIRICLNDVPGKINLTNTIQKEYKIPVVYINIDASKKAVKKAIFTAPYGLLSVPIQINELYTALEMALYKFKLDLALREAKTKIEKLHYFAIDLMDCERRSSVFKKTFQALTEMFKISDLAFFGIQENSLKLLSASNNDLFKSEYKISQGFLKKVYYSPEVCLISKRKEVVQVDPLWKNIDTAIGARISDDHLIIAFTKIDFKPTEERKEVLGFLFQHVRETLKRLEYENLLKQKAVIDPLTKVYNRLYFNNILKNEVKLAKRYGNNIAFIVVDINNLKKINDNYGHNMGDKAIKFVASLLVSKARESDNIIRNGGDEFVLMLPQTGKEVEIVENRIRNAIIESNKKSGLVFPVNFALGSSFWNYENNCDIEEIIQEADEKMYSDKKNKKVV